MSIRSILSNTYYKIRHFLQWPSYFFNHTSVASTTKVASDVSLKYCTVGAYNYIARRCSFYNVKTGNYCCFGPDIHIGGMQHSYWWYSMSPILSEQCGKMEKETIIGNDVWIGAQAIIMQGVKIGDGAVIGANSFVNKDVEPFSIVAGSPAKIIKYRFAKDVCEAITKSGYWNNNPKEAKRILNELNIL